MTAKPCNAHASPHKDTKKLNKNRVCRRSVGGETTDAAIMPEAAVAQGPICKRARSTREHVQTTLHCIGAGAVREITRTDSEPLLSLRILVRPVKAFSDGKLDHLKASDWLRCENEKCMCCSRRGMTALTFGKFRIETWALSSSYCVHEYLLWDDACVFLFCNTRRSVSSKHPRQTTKSQ